MYYTIYQITNTVNGKVYVGKHQTLNLDDGYMGSGKLIQSAIRKYGESSFSKEILHIFTAEYEMNLMEQNIVTEDFCNRTDTYNLCIGGQGGFSYINNDIPFRKQKNSKARKAADKAILEKHGVSNPSQIPGVGDKISKSNKEAYASGTRQKTTPDWTGRTHSQSSIDKMSSSKKGKNTGSTNSQFGTMWITDGKQNKKISKNSSIPNGWIPGRVCKTK